MFKLKQGKRLIISLLCLMLVALLSFSCVVVIENNKRKSQRNNPSAVASQFITSQGFSIDQLLAWKKECDQKLQDGTLSEEQYSSYIEEVVLALNNAEWLTIASKTAFMSWADTVNGGNYINKNVRLLADIDMESEGVGVENFNAIFDGKNYTISNVEYTEYHLVEKDFFAHGLDVFQTLTSKAYGLFTNTGGSAIIQNLRVYNCGRKKDGGLSGPSNPLMGISEKVIGGLIGYGSGKVNNCIIDNFTVYTKDSTQNISIGGIFGAGCMEVTNCIVQNASIGPCKVWAGIGPAANPELKFFNDMELSYDYYYAYGLNYPQYERLTADKCIVRDNNVHATKSEDFYGYTHVYDYNVGTFEYTKVAVGHTVTNGLTSLEALNQIELGEDVTIGGMVIDNPWYYNARFNGGWPYLRSFIEFKEYWFSSTDGGDIKINGQDSVQIIAVPEKDTDDRIMTYDISSYTEAEIEFYGFGIEATPEVGYNFANWSYDSTTKTYTANFEALQINVTFESITITRGDNTYIMEANIGGGNHSLIGSDESFKVEYTQEYGFTDVFFKFDTGSGGHRWSAFYQMGDGLINNIWNRYVLDYITVNGEILTDDFENGTEKEFSIQKVCENTGITIEELAQNGMEIVVALTPKTYGITFG